MFNAQNSYWVALLVAIMLCWSSESMAETGVHGYIIPTAAGPRAPSIVVCSSTSNPIESGRQGRLADRRMTGLDSRRFSASICIPVGGESGPRGFADPRGFSIPIEVAEAIEVVEHSLVAHFEHDSSNFDDVEALPALGVIVSWLDATPNAGIKLQGHTDSTGTPEYNLQLSHRRVESVKSLFVEKGVAADRIRTEWYGENNLLLVLLGRQRDNRRVTIEVYQIIEDEVLDVFVPPVPVDASSGIEVPNVEPVNDPNYKPLPFPLDEE